MHAAAPLYKTEPQDPQGAPATLGLILGGEPFRVLPGSYPLMNKTTNPGYWKSLTIGFEEALLRVPEALKGEGFGVVTEMDLQATFKAKLGVDFRRYRILGACNPGFAHKAVSANPHLGLLLPCNVAVYESDEGLAVVGMVDPMQTLGAASANTSLHALAAEVGERLKRALETLPGAAQ